MREQARERVGDLEQTRAREKSGSESERKEKSDSERATLDVLWRAVVGGVRDICLPVKIPLRRMHLVDNRNLGAFQVLQNTERERKKSAG